MKKKLITMLFAICFMVWLSPVDVFAADPVSWETIKNSIGDESADVSGTGWFYSQSARKITIATGTIVIGDYSIGNYNIDNYGEINGGIFAGYVKNTSNATIKNGEFNGPVWNEGNIENGTFIGQIQMNSGTISGGTFESDASISNGGTISGGTFSVDIVNIVSSDISGSNYRVGTISGGTFNGKVTNSKSTINDTLYECTISSGTFNNSIDNHGIIEDGRFKGDLNNTGTINGGRFSCPKPDTGIVNGGEFNYIETDNDTPNPGDGGNNTSNSGNNTGNDGEYVFVEPVVIVVPEGQKYVENVLEQLSAIPTDGKVIIDTKDWHCFNKTLAEKIADRKDVSVTINYKYQGKKYEVTIPAGSDIVSLLDENGFVGFRYLDAVFGGKEITE